ncbi:hypothetical protein M438DRAFT_348338 [Aureobasidium pullulans EXF-150]|uniref:Uncharacterized protein n=1 Tax=Aureobasidium pullulans EXF-150 TaxID=1043002 RepID=A0A074X615_AURPU|nr:uncharacterized protein M438DRAFT_348338 [Aureobasidium pullulans EXF-150]KEQ80955.1 hypothetical protein M438DRAFT_348338 [Aureobasidium pullulans EXF-150]
MTVYLGRSQETLGASSNMVVMVVFSWYFWPRYLKRQGHSLLASLACGMWHVRSGTCAEAMSAKTLRGLTCVQGPSNSSYAEASNESIWTLRM